MPAAASRPQPRSALFSTAHWPLFAVLAIGAVLLLTNLGRDHLWEDEGDTAVLAATILKTGVPRAWDGVTFTESDHGLRLNDDLVMVSHPWIQYYVTAASFAIFGQNAFAARVPFALAGLGTIVIVYVLVLRASGNQQAAISAALLLLLSVQFLVFSRQARHYSLHAFLTCVLVWTFFRLRSWRSAIAFSVAAIALFHTHPIGIAAIGALVTLTLALRPFAPQRRWCLRALPIILAGTLPWLAIASRGYAENTALLQGVDQLAPRFAQLLIECASVTPIVGIAILFIVIYWKRDHLRGPIFSLGERWLIVTLLAILAAEAVGIAASLSRDILWQIGVRYAPAVLPFAAMLTGLLITKVARSRAVWVALLLIFGFTKAGRITPWTFWEEPRMLRDGTRLVTFHQPPNFVDRVLRTGQVGFLASLVESNPGTIARVTDFLEQHSSPGDLVVTNYEWDSLYFHTGLPQAMKIAATDASYSSAKARGLPDYVFTPGRVRWIVWRPAWGDGYGQNCEQLVRSLTDAGVPVHLVTTVPETLWENRENVHFRRYPGNRYFYGWFDRVPDVRVYRVDWPGGT